MFRRNVQVFAAGRNAQKANRRARCRGRRLICLSVPGAALAGAYFFCPCS